MSSISVTNALLVAILVSLGILFGPGGCYPAATVAGRHQIISMPGGPERPSTYVVLDTASGELSLREPKPAP